MIKHPFNESFSIEVQKATNGSPINLQLSSTDGVKVDVDLTSTFTSEMINYKRVLDIAYNHLKEKFDSLTVDKKLNGEIFIRFIENPIDNNGGYFWYIALVDTNRNTSALLIDPITENILAERVG